MNQRLTNALGIAALSIATTALFMPQASAQDAPNLAPGLDCEALQCINNSDHTYHIRWDALCIAPDSDNPREIVSTDDLISPHETRNMDTSCHGGHSLKDPDRAVQGTVIKAYYKSAEVVNLPPVRPGTGSAG